MSFEEFIITEKYINRLRNINADEKYNYDEIYYQVISKYIFNKSIKLSHDDTPFVLSDSYFSKFKLNDELPFVIKTELEHELMNVEYMNQKIINDKVKDIKKRYLDELSSEEKIRTKMNDGEIFERNALLLDQFKKEFGYDPFFQKSKKTDVLDIQMSDNESEEADNNHETKRKYVVCNGKNNQNQNQNIEETYDSNFENDKKNITSDNSQTETKIGKQSNNQDGIPSLEILNNIIEVLNMDFNNIHGDIIDKDNRPPYFSENKDKCRKPRMTKKAKEEEFQKQQELAALIANNNSDKNIVKEYIKLASKLTDDDIKSPENKEHLENGIKAALQLALFYDNGEKLISSGIKANMIYIYLIKKFNVPDAMYMLGQNLLVGNFIAKNFLHGAKLIKVAAEKYKYKNAIIKLKSMTRTDIVSRVTNKNTNDADNYLDDSE
jgi:hypothetical protein